MTLNDVIAAESKDALLEWAQHAHGVKLNGAYRYETLVEKARELEASSRPGLSMPGPSPSDDQPEAERWLQNPKTGNKFPWTELLQARGDLVPCDPPPPPEPAEAENP